MLDLAKIMNIPRMKESGKPFKVNIDEVCIIKNLQKQFEILNERCNTFQEHKRKEERQMREWKFIIREVAEGRRSFDEHLENIKDIQLAQIFNEYLWTSADEITWKKYINFIKGLLENQTDPRETIDERKWEEYNCDHKNLDLEHVGNFKPTKNKFAVVVLKKNGIYKINGEIDNNNGTIIKNMNLVFDNKERAEAERLKLEREFRKLKFITIMV